MFIIVNNLRLKCSKFMLFLMISYKRANKEDALTVFYNNQGILPINIRN